jgi:hypothetical protein
LSTINSFSKVARYKNQFTKISSLSTYKNEQIEKENKKTIPFQIASKNQIHGNILNKGCE